MLTEYLTWRWRAILLCLPLWFAPGAASAAPLPVGGFEDGLRLAPYAQVLEDAGGALTLAQVRGRGDGWRAGPAAAFSFGLSRSVWWVRFSVVNSTTVPRAVVFDLGTSNQDFVGWFALRPNGELLLENHTGDRTPFPTRLLQGRDLALPYTLAPQQQLDLYVRFASHDGLYELMPMTLSGADAHATRANADNFLLGLFNGGLLALSLSCLMLFASSRARDYGLYVLYLLTFLLNSFCFRGYDLEHFWPYAPGLHNRLVAFSAGFSFATGGCFIMHYLKLREHAPRGLYRLAVALVGLNVLGALLGLADFYTASAVSAFAFGVPLVTVLYGAAIWLMLRGMRAARYIALAFSGLLAGIVAYYLETAGLISINGWGIRGIQAGSAIEMLLLTFGVASSMNLLKTRKLEAERQAREAQQALAGKLGQLVEERTQALAAANHRLNELAITDELTGIFNRRHFNQVCAATLAQPRSTGATALCIFDLDNFKAYNDTYGHLAGDEVLRSVAACVQAALRRSGDSLFRLGGEEFGLLFGATTPAFAQQFVERLREAVAALRIPHTGTAAGVVTASFGVACCPADAAGRPVNLNQLYAAADDRLYEAKDGGRNRVAMGQVVLAE
jgi:diguanylate cyclase (GGDEF)-like protein